MIVVENFHFLYPSSQNRYSYGVHSGDKTFPWLLSWEFSWLCRLWHGPLIFLEKWGGFIFRLGNGQCALVSYMLMFVWSDLHWEETLCLGNESIQISYWLIYILFSYWTFGIWISYHLIICKWEIDYLYFIQ